MIEQRDLIRWFKKGWVYVIITTILAFLIGKLGISTAQIMIDQIISNPGGAFTGLIAVGIIGLIWTILAFPIVSGWLIEEIDKRIRK